MELMLLYPLWMSLAAAVLIYVLSKVIRQELVLKAFSIFFVLNIFFVLLLFSRYSDGIRLYGGRLFIAEITPPVVALSLLITGLVLPFLLSFPASFSERHSSAVFVFLHLLLCAAYGSLISFDPFSFIISFELISVFFLTLINAEKERIYLESFWSLLYFVPSFLFLLAGAQVLADGRGLEIVHLSSTQAFLITIAFASRLFLLPFAVPAIRLARSPDVAAVRFGFVLLLVAGLFNMTKFLHAHVLIPPLLLALATVSSIITSVICYRMKELKRMLLFVFLGGSALVVSFVIVAIFRETATRYVPILFLNEAVCGFGLLMSSAFTDRGGRFVKASLYLFSLLFLGLPVFAVLMLLGNGFHSPDLALLLVPLVSNLFLLVLIGKRFRFGEDDRRRGVPSPGCKALDPASLLLPSSAPSFLQPFSELLRFHNVICLLKRLATRLPCYRDFVTPTLLHRSKIGHLLQKGERGVQVR